MRFVCVGVMAVILAGCASQVPSAPPVAVTQPQAAVVADASPAQTAPAADTAVAVDASKDGDSAVAPEPAQGDAVKPLRIYWYLGGR